MQFKEGERVRFLDEAGEGTVVRYEDKNTVVIEDENGFEYAWPVHKLVKIQGSFDEDEAYNRVSPEVSEIISRNIDREAVKEAQKDFRMKYKNPEATNTRRRGEQMEVDLHIHELVDSTTGLDNADIVDIQMRHFERMMRIAEEQKIPTVVLIHGVGQGVLRAEIRKSLKMYYPNCEFFDADFREYGYGATEVRIKRN